MKQTILFLLMISALLPSSSPAQNFNKVIEIVGGLEESMKGLIAKEERTRTQEIAAIRSDITSLKTALFKEDTVNSKHLLIASADAQSVLDRLEVLENRPAPQGASPEMNSLAGQLDQLVDELKKVVDEGKALQQKQLTVPPQLYTINGQVRHRGEVDGRTFAPEARAIGYNLLRSRFTVSIAPAADTKIMFQLQDSRVFGAGNPALNRGVQDGMSKSIDFHQAYFALTNVFSLPMSVKLGRQELAYGKQRLIASAGWNNFGNTFDALSAQYNAGPATFDAFFAKLVGSQTSVYSENITGLYSLVKYSDAHTADAFVFYDNNTTPLLKGTDKGKARLGRYSTGITLMGKPKPFDYEAELILQRGSYAVTDSSSVSSISAYLYSVSAGYLIDANSKLRVGVKFQVMSGDDNQKVGKYSSYNTLFSSAHSFFGYMDFFPKSSPEYGVRAYSVHSGMELSPELSWNADMYYYLYDAVPTLKTSSGAIVKDQSLGYEADLTMAYKYSSMVTINYGGSAFIPETAMIALKGPAVSYWGFVMTTINF
ncbi:MAG: alginate export family protein [Bacteroidota bacterium]